MTISKISPTLFLDPFFPAVDFLVLRDFRFVRLPFTFLLAGFFPLVSPAVLFPFPADFLLALVLRLVVFFFRLVVFFFRLVARFLLGAGAELVEGASSLIS